MAVEKTIRINNEIANRDLIEFNYLPTPEFKTYDQMKEAVIRDIFAVESNDLYKFEINDIQLAVPPLSIGINKESLDYAYKTLRSKSTTKIQSINAIFHVSITLMFPRETLLQLHRLIIQIRNNPFVYIKNKYLKSSIDHNELFNDLIQNSKESLGNSTSTHFTVFNLQVSNYQQSPGCFLVELDLRYFNHNAYSNNLSFKKELLYINQDAKLNTISVIGNITPEGFKYDNYQEVNLRFYKNSYIQKDSYVERLPTIKTIKDDFLFSKYLSEKLATYAVDSAKESNIYVRYYNRLQSEALWNNFGINIFNEKDDVPNLFEDYGYNDITEWFTRGIDDTQSIPMRVFSLAGKYLPGDIREAIIEKMLANDSEVSIIYETYHKLLLKPEDLKRINSLLKKDVVFNRNPENKQLVEANNKALNRNEEALKQKIQELKDKKEEEIKEEDDKAVFQLIKLVKLSNANFQDLSFMLLTENLANVMSFVHNEVISHDYEILQETSLVPQLKPLAITSLSAMISNQIATIPLLGHHYPTHQYLGSTEPKFSMTFIGNSDPDSRDDMPIGIKKIEQIKNILAFNSNNYKFVPNSNCFALDSFITRLFDSYRERDFLQAEMKDKRISKIDKRLSMNALNIQTIESLPGMSSGTIRISETNVYDYEKISEVYSSEFKDFSNHTTKNILNDLKDHITKRVMADIESLKKKGRITNKKKEIQELKDKLKLIDGNTLKVVIESFSENMMAITIQNSAEESVLLSPIILENKGLDSLYFQSEFLEALKKQKINTEGLISEINYEYGKNKKDMLSFVNLSVFVEEERKRAKSNRLTFQNLEALQSFFTNYETIDEKEIKKGLYVLSLLLNGVYQDTSYFPDTLEVAPLKQFLSKDLLSKTDIEINMGSVIGLKAADFQSISDFSIYIKEEIRKQNAKSVDEVSKIIESVYKKLPASVKKPFFHHEKTTDEENVAAIKELFFTPDYPERDITFVFDKLPELLKEDKVGVLGVDTKELQTNFLNYLFPAVIDNSPIFFPLEITFNEEEAKEVDFSIYSKETRKKMLRICLLESTLLSLLYPLPDTEDKSILIEKEYPEASVFTFANKPLSFLDENNFLKEFLSFLVLKNTSKADSNYLLSGQVANAVAPATDLAVTAAMMYIGITFWPALIVGGLTMVATHYLDQYMDGTNALKPEYSNYFGVAAYLNNATNVDIYKRNALDSLAQETELLKRYFNLEKLIITDLISAEEADDIKREEYPSFDKIIKDLNLKGSDAGLENIFPQIVSLFYRQFPSLFLFPTIRKELKTQAGVQSILLPTDSIGPNEYLGGIPYSTLTTLFWFPTDQDTVSNDDDYADLFKNDKELGSEELNGFLIHDQSEPFDIKWEDEQKYLKNTETEKTKLIFYKRLLDDGTITKFFEYGVGKKESKTQLTIEDFEIMGLQNNSKNVDKVKRLNRNLISLFRFTQEALLLELLRDQDFINAMKKINPEKFEKLEVYEDVEGIDLSNESAYPDIDLPLIPATGNINSRLNPGFFYFNQEEDFLDEFAKDKRKEKDIVLATSIFKKSKAFMNAMKTSGIYSGPDSLPILEKKEKEGKLDITFDELVFDMRDEPNSEKIQIINKDNMKVTQKITGDVLFENGSATVTRKDTHISTVETKKVNPKTGEEAVAVKETKESVDIAIDVLSLPGTVGSDYLFNYAKQIISSPTYQDVPDEQKQNYLNTRIEEKKKNIVQDLKKRLNKNRNSIGDKTGKSDLYTFTNSPILNQTNASGNLDSEVKKLAEETLKIFKGDDQYSDDSKIIEELGIQAFSDRRSIKNAYPTFKFYLVEEDALESSNFNVYDDFYSFNGIKDITIYKSRKLAADTAVIRLQNISGTIDGTKRNVFRDIDYEMGLAAIEEQEEGNRSNNLGIQSIMLRVGVTAQIRLGYDSNPNDLQVMISGKVTDVMWSSNGDMCEATIQSFGVELISKRMGTSADAQVQEIPFKDTQSLIGFVIHQSEMNHFGRFKKNKQIMFYENTESFINLEYTLDEMLVNSTSNSISSAFTTIGAGIAIVGLITTIALYGLTRGGPGVTSKLIGSLRSFLGNFTPGLRGAELKVIDDAVVLATEATAATATFASRIVSTLKYTGSYLVPLFVPVFKGIASLFKATAGTAISKSTALAEYGLFGTLLRMGASSQSLQLTFGEFFLHGIILPYFRIMTTVTILDLFGVSLVSNFIETAIRTIRFSYNYLMGYDMTKEYFRDKFKTTQIRFSPADDCIYVPERSLYINTSQESRLKKPIWNNLSNYLNKVKKGMLDDTLIGNITNFLVGTSSWKFSFEGDSVMEKKDVDEFIRQTFLLADKRLDVIDASYYYYIKNKTSWEVLNEMTLRHTGWITGARPYGLGLEYRLFFGRPNDLFFYKEYSDVTIKLLNETINWLYDYDKDKKEFNQKTTIDDLKTQEVYKLIPSKIKKAMGDETNKLSNYLINNLYSKISGRKKPFRQYHMLSSRFNLIANNIQVNERGHNSVNVKFKFTSTDKNQEGIYTRNMKLHDNIPDEKINTVDIDFSECKGFGAALRYGVSTLMLEAKEMYDGEILCIGKPNINPHDVCIIEDTYNNIYGGIEVEAVTHLFSAETGYITEIRPNMICTSNESTTYPILQSQAIFEASKRVVEELKLIPEDLKDPARLKQEVDKIIDDYFDDSVFSRVIDELKGKNNFANNTNREALSLFSQDKEQAISILKTITSELITHGYNSGDLNFLSNMSRGIAQVPEEIKNSVNKLTTDIAVGSLILVLLSAAVTRRTGSIPVETLTGFQRTIITLTQKSGDLGIYAFASAIFTKEFGETIIEDFLGNTSTMNKIANSLNETNFAKVNDGTLLQMWPLYKNDKPLVANGVEHIKQNYIWHNRFGEIYNTISDAAYGYMNEKERIRNYSQMYGDETSYKNLLRSSPLKFLQYKIKSRYSPSGFTVKDLYTYDQVNPSGLEAR